MSQVKISYYEILGVEKTASAEEIKRAFRGKAKTCHPDHHQDNKEAHAQFQRINEAYEVLKDEKKRSMYDQYGHDAFTSGMNNAGGFGGGFGGFEGFDFSGAGFESIFETIFSGFGGGGHRGQSESRGSDLRYDLEISLLDAYRGLKKNIAIEKYAPCKTCHGKGGKHVAACPTCGGHGHVRHRQGFFMVESVCPNCHGTGKTVKDPCPDCHKTGRVRQKSTLEVNIPQGVDSGVRMRLAGEGNAGLNGNPAGDLYVFLTVKEHAFFKRRGADLFCEVPIPMTTAVLGGDIILPLMDAGQETHTIKPGLQTGTQIKLKGHGMPVLKSGAFGDLYVTFKVETPTHLTARQKELLKEFEQIGQDNAKDGDSFFDKIKKLWES
ncbi:MAG: molecular chaperone DnaJ [Lactobacillales bacterium]|jgi:molecular chaperone DnaJ|nr:molecular chaperone DnaJ [Lactobacillales bacterium]